jgi:uncharacterized protein with HEPN domain
MDEKILKYLFDMQKAINEIDDYFDNEVKDFNNYKNNLMLKRAVERNLEIIGEATNRLLQRDQSFEAKISETKSIIGLRNQIIHAYDNISDENIWSILINHIPKLKVEIDNLIRKHT